MRKAQLILLATFLFSTTDARANTVLNTTRIQFAEEETSKDLIIRNTGDKTKEYKTGWRHVRLTEDYKLEEIKTLFDNKGFADQYIEYTPQSFKIAPNKSQKITFTLNKPKALKNGEYRSQFIIEETNNTNGPNIRTGLSVIFHKGNLKTNIKMSKSEITNNQILTTFINKGNKGAYGDVTYTLKDAEGNTLHTETLKGFAIYADTPKISLRLPIPEEISSQTNSIEANYEKY